MKTHYSRTELIVAIVLCVLLIVCTIPTYHTKAEDPRDEKWEQVYYQDGQKAFRAVHSARSDLTKGSPLRWLWLGDESGAVWFTLLDSNLQATPKAGNRSFALYKSDVQEGLVPNKQIPIQSKSVFFSDERSGYLLRGNTLFATDNIGFRWRPLFEVGSKSDKSEATLFSMALTPSRKACLVGMYSKPMQVKDSLVICSEKPLDSAGLKWKELRVPSQNQLFHIFFNDERKGWIVGTYGTLLTTTNGGKDWEPIKISEAHLFQTVFLNDRKGWIIGWGGTILRTTNGGDDWEPVVTEFADQLSDIALRSIAFADDRRGWIVGDKGTILYTNNGGEDWQLHRAPLLNDPDLNALFIDDTFCWAAGGLPSADNAKKTSRVVWRYRWNY